MVFNRLIENFSLQGARLSEQQRYDLRIAGITLLIWASFLYILDSTSVGWYAGTYLWGLQADGNSLDFNVLNKPSGESGEEGEGEGEGVGVEPQEGGADGEGVEGVEGVEGEGAENTGTSECNIDESLASKIIKGISILLIVVGIGLVFASYSRQNAGWVMPICALFYTFAFVYLISFFRHFDDEGKTKYIYLGITIVLILTGGLIQGLVKDDLEETPEEEESN